MEKKWSLKVKGIQPANGKKMGHKSGRTLNLKVENPKPKSGRTLNLKVENPKPKSGRTLNLKAKEMKHVTPRKRTSNPKKWSLKSNKVFRKTFEKMAKPPPPKSMTLLLPKTRSQWTTLKPAKATPHPLKNEEEKKSE